MLRFVALPYLDYMSAEVIFLLSLYWKVAKTTDWFVKGMQCTCVPPSPPFPTPPHNNFAVRLLQCQQANQGPDSAEYNTAGSILVFLLLLHLRFIGRSDICNFLRKWTGFARVFGWKRNRRYFRKKLFTIFESLVNLSLKEISIDESRTIYSK